jgi:hypothetical protein
MKSKTAGTPAVAESHFISFATPALAFGCMRITLMHFKVNYATFFGTASMSRL